MNPYILYLYGWADPELTPLQNEQVRKGKLSGLSDEEIRSYAKRCYNFLQMRELRRSIESGLSEKERRKLRDPSLPAGTMRVMREKMERGEAVRSRPFRFLQIIPLILPVLLVLLTAVSLAVNAGDPVLVLKESEITLQEGEPFCPMDYVACYSEKKSRLFLPAEIDTETAGTYAAVYRLVKEKQEISKILLIHVEKAP